jgi:tetratricopeptide (TPR) repeat protein
LGEAYFLNGQNKKELAAFERARGLFRDAVASEGGKGKYSAEWPPYIVRQAFMYELLKDYGKAAELYRYTLDVIRQRPDKVSGMGRYVGTLPTYQNYDHSDQYSAAKHLGDVLLMQARNYEVAQDKGENADDVRARYEEAAKAYSEVLEDRQTIGPLVSFVPNITSAANNLGLALIKIQDYEGAIKVLKTLVEPSSDPPAGWIISPVSDQANPVSHLNLGWAYGLNGKPEKAKEQYLAAVRGDPTFHPALNDLGVLAAKSGEVSMAQGYFDAALEAKPDYDYAAHNLGAVRKL